MIARTQRGGQCPPYAAMQITLNGKSRAVDQRATVADLLEGLVLQPVRVAVEVNEDIVSRERYADTLIREGDRIEIVTFVGGG